MEFFSTKEFTFDEEEIEQKIYLNFSSARQGLSLLKYLKYLKFKFK